MNHRRDERGATVVLFALLALVLLGVGAVAVDMGQVYAKRGSLQSTVDLAVLAAAAELDGSDACTAAATAAATSYLQKNWIDGTHDPLVVNLGGSPNDDDGYIRCTGWDVQLWAPKAHVDFGLAKALSSSNDGLDVPAFAEAAVESPGLADMPFYATPGCSTGLQVLSTDSKGQSTPPPVPLSPPYPGSSAFDSSMLLTSITPSSSPVVPGPSFPLVITGKGFKGATAVGFTNASGDHYPVTLPVPSVSDTTITVAVPTTVTNVDDVWYVRVLKGGLWSASDGNATTGVQKLTIGPEKLYCLDSQQGNFGSLFIDRSDEKLSQNGTLSLNVAVGVDHRLDPYPGAPKTPAPNECKGLPLAVTDPIDGQNCVLTDTGLPANALEEGLLTGISNHKGRLDTGKTSPCERDNVNVGKYSINDDVLTCFFLEGATNSNGSPIRVGDVTKASYTGGSAIGPEIFDSPRFFWVPVIAAAPKGSKYASIQDFRPAFITDQAASATKASQGTTLTQPNGLTLNGTKVREVKVAFLNIKALPESITAQGGEHTYLGFGPKVIVLIK